MKNVLFDVLPKEEKKEKRPRIKWFDVVTSSFYLQSEFNKWMKSKKRKIKSLDRCAYLFLLSHEGRWFIDYIWELAKSGKYDPEVDYVRRIVRTNIWNLYDED